MYKLVVAGSNKVVRGKYFISDGREDVPPLLEFNLWWIHFEAVGKIAICLTLGPVNIIDLEDVDYYLLNFIYLFLLFISWSIYLYVLI